jgi:hypothetical protein
MIRVLLSDGTGPLFQPGNRVDLRVLLHTALAALDPSTM